MDFSQKVDLRAFTLADPYRVVIDLPQVTFKLPAKTGETGRGLVKAFRFGLVMQGGSRIVIDVGKPVRIDKAFVLDAADGQPARLVLDLAATDRDSFMRTHRARQPRRAGAGRQRTSSASAARDGDPRPIDRARSRAMAASTTAPSPASGEMEKDDRAGLRALLRDQLEKSGKYRVVMTRTDDTFIPLVERVRIARTRQARAVHLDPCRRAASKSEGDAQGATVYTLSETASDAEAARLAEDENRADVIAGIDLSPSPTTSPTS